MTIKLSTTNNVKTHQALVLLKALIRGWDCCDCSEGMGCGLQRGPVQTSSVDPATALFSHSITLTHISVHKGNRISSNNVLHILIWGVLMSETEMTEHNWARNEISGEW